MKPTAKLLVLRAAYQQAMAEVSAAYRALNLESTTAQAIARKDDAVAEAQRLLARLRAETDRMSSQVIASLGPENIVTHLTLAEYGALRYAAAALGSRWRSKLAKARERGGHYEHLGIPDYYHPEIQSAIPKLGRRLADLHAEPA
jgi:hypothetical protein